MTSLKEFLEGADLGVESSGDEVHIGVSLLEHAAAVVDGLELLTPTVTAEGVAVATGAATIGGLTLAVTGPILGMTGVFMALGSGYEEAREEIRNEATLSGFSQGFVAGLLRMSTGTVSSLFARHNVIHRNDFDPDADVIETKAYNKGLVAGYTMASQVPDDDKKTYILEIRASGADADAGNWGDREKIDYVIEYGAKLRLNFIGQ
jgi:hypothetical protein